IEKYDVEKIKTIGDAYMCAGGIPIRNKSNPIDTVLAGLEIQRFMKTYNKIKTKNGESAWGLRVGIHTGNVVAGVVGIKRFAYDIWGDSVNVASRIEAASAVGKVNVSGATYELIKEFFTCEYRGKIKAKNKGNIDMYFVHTIKPELSIDGKGIEPNELFQKYVDLHIYSGINYRKAEKYIVKRLKKELPDNLHYHDLRHTTDVCAAVERLALMEGIEGDDIFLLKTAALYHDAGFVHQYANNEDLGAELAREVLPRFGYTEDQLDTICKLIQATKVPQKPNNHLEQIICDADLDYLGGDEFHFIADKLKRELMERDMVQTDKQWDELQIKFLQAHTYFTKTAIRLRQANKMDRVQEIKDRLKGYK
ncbi:MAG: adenylate/guanylate cyclase domain-containing protein, partial [Vicingaceae bacterium]|nr:adenylate/guanylate cyclase domain-containing protein [Vicingaceae bacterium]